MVNPFIKYGVRAIFACTGRKAASGWALAALNHYVDLMRPLSEEQGRTPVTAPSMPGVDEDMRGWSLYQMLEHNVIVNRAISATVIQLARGESLNGEALTDPKHGVMPSVDPGPEIMDIFAGSVQSHIDAAAKLGPLRGTARSDHTVFGSFDAHRWHCMFGFHLKLHLKQARYVAAQLNSADIST